MISLLVDNVGTQLIDTERLVLRPFELSDAESVFRNWMSDRELQLMYQEPACSTVDEVKTLLSEYINKYKTNQYYRWAIIEKTSGECIGQIAFYVIYQRTGTVEYCIGRDFQHKGYATEALKAVIEYGFERIKLHRIEADRRSDNIKSGKVIEKCGLQYEGTCRDKIWANGRFYNSIVYGITREEWGKRNSKILDVSGPITTPLNEEAIEIQKAPAYALCHAKRIIDNLPRAIAAVDCIKNTAKIQVFGTEGKAPNLEVLNRELEAVKKDNHNISFLLINLERLNGIAYNIDMEMCTQSSIKGPYIGALLESDYDLLQENGQNMHDAIVNSDNDAYLSLCRKYGFQPIRSWAKDVGVDPYVVQIPFPRLMTVRDMAKLWVKMYAFLNEENDKTNFAKYFAKTAGSGISYELGKDYPVQTKAGWEWNPCSNKDRCACNDCGIVYSKNGPYVEVIFTDIPWDLSEPNPIQGIVRILDHINFEL